MLTIELVPETCFFSNLRNAVAKEDWDRLRFEVYAKAKNRCEVCGGRGPKWPLEAHEAWEYDDDKHVQKLVGIVGLCPACHEVKHYGRAQIMGREDEAFEHLMKVNGWDEQTAVVHVEDAAAKWAERSGYKWRQDLSWATGKVFKWKDKATRKAAIDAGFKEIEKDRRHLSVAREMMEE